jgi:hypothetical protein
MSPDSETEAAATPDVQSDADTEAQQAAAQAEAAVAPDAEETTEAVTDLPPAIEAKQGNIPDAELEALKPVCTMADESHQQVLGHIKEIKAAENVLHQFRSRKGNTTPQDVDKAKQQFHQAKQSYIQLGNQINDGIKKIHTAARTYPDDLLVQNLYKIYLAKLLSSLETRNPLEPLVETLSMGIFDFARHDVAVEPKEAQAGMTVEKKAAQMMEDARQSVLMLETRYQKRQLHNRLRQGEKSAKVIKRLQQFLRQDPEDLHTYIWLANLLAEQYATERNQNTRVALRDDILNYCKRAFAKIDDFLNLQGIQQLADRDRRRAEYVKTITGIRKPLVNATSSG